MPDYTPSFGLPYPKQIEVADVPEDMKALAVQIESILNLWYSPAEQDEKFQRKVIVKTAPLPAEGAEGDIVFLVTE